MEGERDDIWGEEDPEGDFWAEPNWEALRQYGIQVPWQTEYQRREWVLTTAYMVRAELAFFWPGGEHLRGWLVSNRVNNAEDSLRAARPFKADMERLEAAILALQMYDAAHTIANGAGSGFIEQIGKMMDRFHDMREAVLCDWPEFH